MRFVLAHENARCRAAEAVRSAPNGFVVTISEPSRSSAQNAIMWPLLEDIAQQVDWYGQKLTRDEWKDVFTASLRKQRAVPGIDGGFVLVGGRTSKMSKSEFSDLLELVQAFGAERGVKFRGSEHEQR